MVLPYDFGCSLAPSLIKLGVLGSDRTTAREEDGVQKGEGIYETWIKRRVLYLYSISFSPVFFIFLLQQRYSPDTPTVAISFVRLLRLNICDDGGSGRQESVHTRSLQFMLDP